MKTSENGIALIIAFEGLRLDAYKDIAGVWTIGYGSTRHVDGKAVKPGDSLQSKDAAMVLFIKTLETYEAAVNRGVLVPLTQNQYDALVSITYNVGTGIMLKSTLVSLLKVKNYAGAADQFLVWNKITDPKTGKKVVSKTLSNRRAKERALFLQP